MTRKRRSASAVEDASRDAAYQATSIYFVDDERSLHEADINRLRAAGITGGCAADRFCPDAVVTRAQMAAFLRRALD